MSRGRFRKLKKELHTIAVRLEQPSVAQTAVIMSLIDFIEDQTPLARKEQRELHQLIRTIQTDLFGRAILPDIILRASLLFP